MVLKIKRKLGTTEVQYKIICAGSKFDLGADKTVTVCFRGQSYSAKTHKSVKGRIDGLTKMYRDYPEVFALNNEIELEYDEAKNVINITTDIKINGIREEGSPLADKAPCPNEGAETSLDNRERFTPEISDFPVMSVDFDFYGQVMNILHEPYSDGMEAASIGKLIVFSDSYLLDHIYVFERHGGTGKFLITTLRYEEGEETGYAQLPFILKNEMESVYLYWGGFSNVYKTDIYTGETKRIVKDLGKNPSVFLDYITAFRVDDNGRVICLVESLGQNDSIESVVIKCGRNSWKIPRKYYWRYGKAGEVKMCGVSDEETCSIYCYGNHFFRVNADSGEMDTIFDEDMDYNEEEDAYYSLNMCDVLPFRNVKKEGSLRWESIKDGTDNSPYDGSSVYYTPGGKNAIGVTRSYYFFVAERDDYFRDDNCDGKYLVEEMFYTNAACVPETFHMINGMNAIVKVKEDQISIVDFDERRIYTFDLM